MKFFRIFFSLNSEMEDCESSLFRAFSNYAGAIFVAGFFVFAFSPINVSALIIVSEDITENATWTKVDSPCVIGNSIIVDIGATLSIEPGAIIKFADYSYVEFYGTLSAIGTEGDPIYFTSLYDSSVGGDTNGVVPPPPWYTPGDPHFYSGFYLYNDSAKVHKLQNAVVRYADDIYFDNTRGFVSGVKVENGDYGIDSNNSILTINDSSFRDMREGAIWASSGRLSLDGVEINGVEEGEGISLYDGVNFIGKNLIVKNITNYAGFSAGDSISKISDSLFENVNDGIGIFGGEATISTTTVRLSAFSGLTAIGAEVNGVGLSLENNLVGVLIQSQGSGGGPVPMFASDDIDDVSGDFDVDDYIPAEVSIYQSRIFGNSQYGAINEDVFEGLPSDIWSVVDLRKNWWGDENGPYNETSSPDGIGNEVSEGIQFIPWLPSDPSLPPSEPEEPDPVIIIPGILGSSQKNGEWVIDPIFHTYDDLVETLDVNDYTLGKDLFTFPYDWRNSNVLTAVALKNKIDEVKGICQCDKVDLVAHSMGGLVARQYIQSDQYGGDVDQLIFLGTPHLGAPKAYLPWEGADVPPKDASFRLLKLLLSREASKLDYDLFDYIREEVVSIGQLLPVYDYLKDSGETELRPYPEDYPTNNFLETLNANISKLYNSGVSISNIIGNTGTSTINVIRVIPSPELPLWEHGRPQEWNVILSDNGLENGSGDETVPVVSSTGVNSPDLVYTNSKHSNLPTEAESYVYKKLTRKDASQLINNGLEINFLLLIKMLSPADIQIIAPDGKKIGKNFETGGEFNEIDGAFYSGFQTDDEYVTIPNPLDGEYKVVTQGTGGGGGYTVATGYISDNVSKESDFTGQTLPGMISEVNVEISSSSPEVIEVTPEDNVPPVITVISPEARDYPRSESFVISATSTDEGSGVFKFEFSLVPLETELASSSLIGIDPFYEKLGNRLFFATSTDFMNNIATSSIELRFVATASSTISDIERTYSLGWITKKQIKDSLIRQINAMVRLDKRIEKIEERLPDGSRRIKRIERIEHRIDKILGRLFAKELQVLLKTGKINQKAHDLLKEDIEWLLKNY